MGDDDRLVSFADEVLAEFKGAALDASGVEFGKDLQDFHRDTMGWFRCRSISVLWGNIGLIVDFRDPGGCILRSVLLFCPRSCSKSG